MELLRRNKLSAIVSVQILTVSIKFYFTESIISCQHGNWRFLTFRNACAQLCTMHNRTCHKYIKQMDVFNTEILNGCVQRPRLVSTKLLKIKVNFPFHVQKANFHWKSFIFLNQQSNVIPIMTYDIFLQPNSRIFYRNNKYLFHWHSNNVYTKYDRSF